MYKFLNKEEMEKLSTSRLLAYKRKRLSGIVPDDMTFQESDLREKALHDIIEILSSRPHVERLKRGNKNA
jgi:hypothetical protein